MLNRQQVDEIATRAERAKDEPELNPLHYEGYEGIAAATFACRAPTDVLALVATVREQRELLRYILDFLLAVHGLDSQELRGRIRKMLQ